MINACAGYRITSKVTAKWSLLTDGERKKGWRYNGDQHTAIHGASNCFYV